MKFNTLVVSFLLFSGLLLGQIPTDYYSSAEGKSGYELKTALYQIIKDHNSQSYNSLWTHFQKTDKKSDNSVWDMYSDIPGGTPAYVYTFISDQCGNYSGEGSCYNREHSWPKSWFDDASPMYTDLFHLYPTDGYVNSKRSNFPFGEVDSPTWTSTNDSKVGSNSTEGYSSTVFEPIDEYKGDFARSYFYMATRYENVIGSWVSNLGASEILDGTSNHVFKDWQLNLLLKWHKQDPVSQKEISRNNEVYTIQKNRNPFIDHPEYASQIWDSSSSLVVTLLFEDFENESVDQAIQITNWINSAETGTVLWLCDTYNNNQYAQFTAYQAGETQNNGWLVTENIPLSQYQNGELSFLISGGFDNGATLEAFVLKNYQSSSNPWEGQLDALSFNLPNIPPDSYANQWSSSGTINLSSYNEDVRIAFKYSGGEGINRTTTWQIDDILVKAETKSTGILSNQFEDYQIYPNPSKGSITINGEFNAKNNQISIFNSSGQMVFNVNKENFNQTELSLSHLPKGIYILKIQAKNKQFKSKKVILH